MTVKTRLAVVGWILAALAVGAVHGDRAAARSKNHALVLYGHAFDGQDFLAETNALATSLQKRGYTTEVADTDTTLVHPFKDIQRYLRGESAGIPSGRFLSRADTLAPGDRLVLAIECHGGLNAGVYRNASDQVDENGFIVSSNGQTIGTHNACSISSDQVARLAAVAKERHIEMIVIDASCSGGASTFLLEPMGVCAVSTAAPGTPSVTGDPPFSQYLNDRFVRTFSDMAVAGGMSIFAQFPERHQQSGFYSTASGHAAEAMTLRASLFALEQSLSGWTLWTTDVYPYVFQAARTLPIRQKLGMRDPPPHPSSPDLALLMKMGANFDGLMQNVVRTAEERWRQEDAQEDPRKEQLFDGYRGTEFVTSPLLFATAAAQHGALIAPDQANHVPLLRDTQIPPSMPQAHQLIVRLMREIEANQRVITANLTTLETDVQTRRSGSPSTPSASARQSTAAIVRAELSDQRIVGVLSKLLGIIEDVESRSDQSPCNVPIG
jgi:hypothetical protein